jgi:predicted dienelactone hydrolase
LQDSGPFQPGYRLVETSYVMPTTGEVRVLPLHVWYPTDDLTGDEVRHEGLFLDEGSLGGATPAAPVHGEAYPVMAYSHGHQGFGGSSSFLMRHVASHGWVAVAPDHVGNTLSTNVSPRPVHTWIDRSFDMSAAIDAVEEGLDFLPAPADATSVPLVGHSYGAHMVWASVGAVFDSGAVRQRCADDPDQYAAGSCTEEALTAFEAGALDERFVAGVPMAGRATEDWFDAAGVAEVDVPMLQMSGSEDAGAVAGMWERAPTVAMTWIDVAGGCHQTFGLGSPCTTLEAEPGFAITRTYAFALARSLVLGDDSENTRGILDGSVPVSDRVTFQMR